MNRPKYYKAGAATVAFITALSLYVVAGSDWWAVESFKESRQLQPINATGCKEGSRHKPKEVVDGCGVSEPD